MRVEGKPPPFDPKTFLARVGAGKTRAELRMRQIVFAQGDPADAVFYIQKGKVELRVLSQQSKEAILAILGADDFFCEGCPVPAVRQMMVRIDDRQLRFEDPLLPCFASGLGAKPRRGPSAPTSGAGNRALPVRFRHSYAARGQS